MTFRSESLDDSQNILVLLKFYGEHAASFSELQSQLDQTVGCLPVLSILL
jgi:hypothetical protein